MAATSSTAKSAIWQFSREALIDSAARTLSRHGIEGTTIRQIANDAGIALGSLYVYFKSKDELVSAVYERGMGTIAAEVRYAVSALPASVTPIDRLEFAVRVHIRAAVKHGDYSPLMQSARQMSKQETIARFLRISEEYQQYWKDLIEQAQHSGALRNDMTNGRFLYVLTGAMTWLAGRYESNRGPLEPLIDDVINIFLAKPFIRRAAKSPAGTRKG